MRIAALRTAAVIAAVLVTVGAIPVLAQDGVETIKGAEVSEPVVPYVFDGDVRDLPPTRDWQPGDPIRVIHHWQPAGEDLVGGDEQSGARSDPLLDIQNGAGTEASRAFTTPILNIAGLPYSGVFPPDTVGDVGANHYIQAINHSSGGTRVKIFNKDGSQAAVPFYLESLATGGQCTSGEGDVVVLYDQLADRWMLSEFSVLGNHLCVYISQTSDPVAGGWYAYDFETPLFPDYPKLGLWRESYIGTAQDFDPVNLTGINGVYAFDREAMLVGDPATYQRFTRGRLPLFTFQSLTPVDLDGMTAPPAGTPAIIMRHRDTEGVGPPTYPTTDLLEWWEFTVDWDDPGNTTLVGPRRLEISEFDSNLCNWAAVECIPQPGTTQKLDTIKEVVMWRLAYRNFGAHQSMVGNLTVDVGADQAGIRWFEMRDTGSGWTLHQEGTYAPDADHRWMGSIAQDSSGNIALGYSISGSMFPAVRYTGRLATDTLGTMSQPETELKAGTGYQNFNRWGDYSAMSIDPQEGCTFWYTQMWAAVTHTWSTRIGAFKFDACEAYSIFTDGFESGDTSGWDSVVGGP